MKQDEYSRLPEEHPKSADEFLPLPPEFPEHAPRFLQAGKRKPHFWAAAAAVFLGMLVLSSPEAPMVPATEPVSLAQPTIQPTESPETAATEPEPFETAPMEPEQFEMPVCKSIFFSFSDALRAKLIFQNPEAIQSVTAELWDSVGQTMEQSWQVPREAILLGSYDLPDMMGIFDMFLAHHTFEEMNEFFPVPELRISMTYSDGTQEMTVELVQPVSEELGWGVRARDGQIVFSTYESKEPTSIRVFGENPQNELHTLVEREMLITVTVDGEYIPADRCTVEQTEETWQNAAGEDVIYHYASLHTPLPETGTAVVTVYQKLTGYDAVWIESSEVTQP